ncbi:MAG: hypothetical protein KGO83_07390, partial [Paenibacillaceae bacterium]|nr:hypothetical protein [Paenibacillaceae bacterium]
YGIGLLTTAFVHPLNAVTPLNNESDIIYVNGAASLLYDQKMNNDLKNLMHVLVHEHRHLEQFAHICRANRTCTHDAPLRRYAYEPLIHQELRVFSEGDAVYATCRVTSTSCLDDLVTLHPRAKRPSKRTTCTAAFARGSYGCAYALVAEITKDFLNALTTKHRANPPDWFGAVLRMPNAMSHPVRFAHVLRAVFATYTTYKEYDIHASGADVRAYAWLYTHTMMRRCGARSCPGT